jgi:hypothetical protein
VARKRRDTGLPAPFLRRITLIEDQMDRSAYPMNLGFLDEAFELLTLVQTGKSYPVPIVLLDHPDSTYWARWQSFVDEELLAGGRISESDTSLYLHTNDPAEAVEYICAFYSCYHSIRYVGRRLVIRLLSPIGEENLAILNREFADIVASGRIEAMGATRAEQRDDDNVELPRIGLHFDQRGFARLHQMIVRINELGGRSGASAAAGLVHDVDPHTDVDAGENGDDAEDAAQTVSS